MEEQNKPFAERIEAFFAGKGFYIVLFLCVAVIGLSAWSMLAGGREKTDGAQLSMAVSGMDETLVTAEAPVFSPAPASVPLPVSTPAAVTIPEAPVPEKAAETAAQPEPPAAPPATVTMQDYYIWPVAGTVENPYSMDALTYNRTMQDWRTHDGIDIAAELGTQVKAAANGRVAEIRTDDLYGTTVVLSHRDGLVSIYSNLAAQPTVSVGDNVGVGQVIGAVGDTALCEAGEVCHLHFAMTLDGESVDPAEDLP